MRHLFPFMALLFICNMAHAQTDTPAHKPNILICTPSREQMLNSPLYLVFYGKKQVLSIKNRYAFSSPLNPRDIKSVNVLKGAEALQKYGDDAKFGAVEIYLKRGKHLIKNNNPLPVDTLTRYRR
jgi:hypothetical protein